MRQYAAVSYVCTLKRKLGLVYRRVSNFSHRTQEEHRIRNSIVTYWNNLSQFGPWYPHASRLVGTLFKGLSNVLFNHYQQSKEQVKHSPKEINTQI